MHSNIDRTYLFQGIRGNNTDACEEHDPCQHGGICISTDSGPICECRNLDYEGIFCEKGKVFMLLFFFLISAVSF